MKHFHRLQNVQKEVNWMHETFDVSKCKLYVDLVYTRLRTNCSIRDYETFRFFDMNIKEIGEYLTMKEMNGWYAQHNSKIEKNLLKNKEASLRLFDKYVKRDWCGTTINNSIEDFTNFLRSHSNFIIKPLCGSEGDGIRFANSSDYDSAISLMEQTISNNELIEELIEQHPVMASICPSSVNTIRLVTLQGKPYEAFLRMSDGVKRVDNASTGGLFAGIDMNTGIIYSNLQNFMGQTWEQHPKSGITAKGFEIPYWELCVELVSEASKLVSGMPIIGWDIAITSNGPILVEANGKSEHYLVTQIINGKGSKRQFLKDTEKVPKNR